MHAGSRPRHRWRVCMGARPGPARRLSRPHPQGTPADVLYKGTITRIIGEDSPSRLDRSREDGLPKGHVIYEGKKGHVLSYEGEFCHYQLCRAGGASCGFPASLPQAPCCPGPTWGERTDGPWWESWLSHGIHREPSPCRRLRAQRPKSSLKGL